MSAVLQTAYLGPEASFSHQAVVESLRNTDAIPLPSFKAILKALQESETEGEIGYDYAVLPVENSTNGSVVQALDLLAQCGLDPSSSAYPDVEAIDEYYLEVHHCLFVPRIWAEQKLNQEELALLPFKVEDIQGAAVTAARNGLHRTTSSGALLTASKLGSVMKKLDIKTLYTHPQVWGQCNNLLSALLPPGIVDRIDMSSTSAAAAFVATNDRSDQSSSAASGEAAISSSLAGAKHPEDLVCIATNIEDDPGANTTRFLILRNRKRPQAKLGPSIQLTGDVQIRSLFVFTTAHYVPGSLAVTLSVLAKHAFNLCAIQSRPRPKLANIEPPSANTKAENKKAKDPNWRYVFFVECLHNRDAAQLEQADQELESLLKDLQPVTEQVKLLGSWRNRLV